MPFTPFHLGAGATFKALSPKYCSFTMFGFMQVINDTEPLYYMVQGLWPIHRFFHTYLGATSCCVVHILREAGLRSCITGVELAT